MTAEEGRRKLGILRSPTASKKCVIGVHSFDAKRVANSLESQRESASMTMESLAIFGPGLYLTTCVTGLPSKLNDSDPRLP